MKKTLTIILILIALVAGYFYSQSLNEKKETPLAQEENTEGVVVKEKEENVNSIGVSIEGDFDGDGKIENAVVVKIKEGTGYILDGENARGIYEIQFSNKNIPNINIDCCEAILINEGDLNNDEKDEISIYQSPLNGFTYIMETFSFVDGKWIDFIPAFLIPTATNAPTEEQLKDRIFKEGESIYYYDVDENFNLVKTKVVK